MSRLVVPRGPAGHIVALALAAMLSLSGCSAEAALGELAAPTLAAPTAVPPTATSIPPTATSVPPSPSPTVIAPPSATPTSGPSAAEAAIRTVIQKANDAQAAALAQRKPALLKETATDAYYQEIASLNQSLLDDGVAAISLIKLDWGPITITGATATATTFETWRTDYGQGPGVEQRDRNVYTLVLVAGQWKIQADQHPDSGIEQPAGDSVTGSPTPAGTPLPAAQTGRGGQSSNWSGYSATSGTFTSVTGTWSVPKPNLSVAGSGATWVGIGGTRSRDLIQAGTQETVSATGRVLYEAWVEMLPQASHAVQLRINGGDSVTVSITEQTDGAWLIVLKNNASGLSYKTTETYRSTHSSAEWIEEAPRGRRGLVPLDDFGIVSFQSASAIKDGKVLDLASVGARPVSMIGSDDQTLAQPSRLASDGASFTVTRVLPDAPPKAAATRSASRAG